MLRRPDYRDDWRTRVYAIRQLLDIFALILVFPYDFEPWRVWVVLILKFAKFGTTELAIAEANEALRKQTLVWKGPWTRPISTVDLFSGFMDIVVIIAFVSLGLY